MGMLGPVVGEFGAARVVFADAEQRIPPDLLAEFLALTVVEPEPKLLNEWTRRLEASIGVTEVHRRTADLAARGGRRWHHGLSKDMLRASFSEYFGLGPEYVDILVVLYERPYESVPTKRLRYLIDSHRPPKYQTVYERIRVLREVMEPEAIDSGGQLNPEGYRLTDVGYEDCRNALNHMADVLKRHSAESRALMGGEEV